MLHDYAQVKSNYQTFLKRVVEKETVYYLSNEDGVANSVSNEDEEIVILMFWSDKAYANRAEKVLLEDFVVTEMPLFNFLYQWLPGMTNDGVLAGPNWNGDLAGLEIDPFELRTEIEKEMSSAKLEEYEAKYNELTG